MQLSLLTNSLPTIQVSDKGIRVNLGVKQHIPLFEGIFHPVGNGLAYTGVWGVADSFFVYDVGSQSKQWGLPFLDYLRFLKYEGLEANLLIISHFHTDHIRHLQEFLNLFQPKNVILPYFFPKEGLQATFVIASLAARGLARFRCTQDLLHFWINPIEYIIQRSPKAKIYLVKGEEPRFNEPPSTRSFYEGDDLMYFGDSERLFRSNVFVVNGYGYWVYSTQATIGGSTPLFWLFRAYNPLLHKNGIQRLQEFRDKIRSILGKDPEDLSAEELYIALKDYNIRRRVAQTYRTVFSDLNITSMQLWHGPSAFSYDWSAALCCYPCCLHRFKCLYWYLFDLPIQNLKGGTYLSGDLPLNRHTNTAIQSLHRHFDRLLDKTGIVQVPHHGSNATFNSGYISLFAHGNPIFVLSGLKPVPRQLLRHKWVRYLVYSFCS